MQRRKWIVHSCEQQRCGELAEVLGVSRIVAHILINRDLGDPDDARAFLQPSLNDLADPSLLPDIEKATGRICKAVRDRESILIYGDYDVDGVTSIALLSRFLNVLGAEADYYIPHRVDEGYGLNREAVKEAIAKKYNLIVTVDCGTTAVEEVAEAQRAGIDVIVTDHHEPGRWLPPAFALVNPKLTGNLYPFRDMSGVGVVFKLMWAMANELSPGKKVSPEFREFLMESLALVALGTICDVVPLRGENRVLAQYGLRALEYTANAGVRSLVEVSSSRFDSLTADTVAFRIGPRLNAAGRMGRADLCVELLTTTDRDRAQEIARELGRQNSKRQRIQSQILEDARSKINDDPNMKSAPALVLGDPEWHAGVIGIVAAKIAEELYRPVILLSTADAECKGSGRSIPDVHLFNAVQQCEDILLSFGGHERAIGLSIRRDNIADLQRRLGSIVAAATKDTDLVPTLHVDAEVDLPSLTEKAVRDLMRLAPFGELNRRPLFVAKNVKVAGRPSRLGQQGQHLSFIARQGNTTYRAIAFNFGDRYAEPLGGQKECDLAFHPQINRWQGSESVELHVKDIALASDDVTTEMRFL